MGTRASVEAVSNSEKDTYLVFSSGGIKGIAYCGALNKLISLNKLRVDNIKGYAGTSVGSIYAGLLAVGYTPAELTNLMLTLDINDLLEGNTSYMREGINVYEKFGEVTGQFAYEYLGKLIEVKTGNKDTTIEELYKEKGIELIMVGTNISLSKEVWFEPTSSVEDYRNIPIRLAIRISMSIPFRFEPVIYKNHYYVDGALVKVFPYDVFNKRDNKNIIGFLILSKCDENTLQDKPVPITCFSDFASATFNTVLLSNVRRTLIDYADEYKLIEIITPDYPLGVFDLTKEQKEELIKCGENSVV
jgi:predicted acylesterase/phospholipase RssA